MNIPSTAAITAGGPRQPTFTGLSTSSLFSTAVGSFAARALGPASSVLLTMLLARELGAERIGILFAALTLVTACSIISKFGLDTALQRHIGAARGAGDLPLVLGLYRQSLLLSFVMATIASLVWAGSAGAIAGWFLGVAQHTDLVRSMTFIIGPVTFLGVNAAMLKALGKPVWGGFMEAAAWPACTASFLAVSNNSVVISLYSVAIIYSLSAVVAAAWGYVVLRRSLPNSASVKSTGARELIASCVPLTGVDLINFALLWAPFLLLPALADAGEAGLYNVSHKLAAQLGLLMIVFASVTLPRFAAHFRVNDYSALANLAGRSSRAALMMALPPAAILLIFSDPLLGLFGADFVEAEDTLHILVLGQLFNLATGPAGYLLAMTGRERWLRNSLLAAVATSLLLALFLIPGHGAVGAALSVVLPSVLHKLVCCSLTARHLNLPFFLILAR